MSGLHQLRYMNFKKYVIVQKYQENLNYDAVFLYCF
jgi:hypothetical protein